MPRYFFDITGTVWHLKRADHFSGIQRTVVMLVEKTAELVGPENVHLSYFDKSKRMYCTFPYASLEDGELTSSNSFRRRLGYRPVRKGLHPSLRKYRDRRAKLYFHTTLAWLNALFHNDRFFNRRNTTRAEWFDFHGQGKRREVSLQTSSFESLAEAGDHLVLLDGTFTVSRAAESFHQAKLRGLHVHTMVHDLIPITAPELVPQLNQLTFHEWLRASEFYTTQYLTNSEATRQDLDHFCGTYGIEQPVNVIRLAQARLPAMTQHATGPLLQNVDLGAYPGIATESLDARIQAITSYPFVLCVGTIEIRKNVWRLATVWDRLRRKEGINLPKLVFAGKSGWMKQDFDALLAATGNIFGWVEIIESPSDAELAHLYRKCQFLVMPSLYEGWGLPVGEALSYGKTAVVSSTSSLPEVGEGLVEYCDPTSIDSITDACLRLIADPIYRADLEQRIQETPLRGWEDVASDLVAAIRS
jgi:glycosyltransferase involved in cell wall biosynthesis